MKLNQIKVGQKFDLPLNISNRIVYNADQYPNLIDGYIPTTLLKIGTPDHGSFNGYYLVGWKDNEQRYNDIGWAFELKEDKKFSVSKTDTYVQGYKYFLWLSKDNVDVKPIKELTSPSLLLSFGIISSLAILNKKVSSNEYGIRRREGRSKN